MPSEAISDVKIGSRACKRAGLGPITSFEDGSAAATVLADNYDSVVDNGLSLFPWPFALAYAELGAPRDDVDVPYPYSNGYTIPDTVFKIHKLEINSNRTTDWKIYGDVLYCYGGPNDTVGLTYTYRVDESKWHPTFVEWVVWTLAELLATGVAHDAARSKHFAERAEMQWRRARHAVSMEDTPDQLDATRLISTRY